MRDQGIAPGDDNAHVGDRRGAEKQRGVLRLLFEAKVEAHVDLPAAAHVQHVFRRRRHKVQDDLRVLFLEAPVEIGVKIEGVQVVHVGHADMRPALLQIPALGDDRVGLADQLLELLIEGPAALGQHHAARTAGKEGKAQGLLQRVHLLDQRRVGDVELFRRGGEALALGHGEKALQLVCMQVEQSHPDRLVFQ